MLPLFLILILAIILLSPYAILTVRRYKVIKEIKTLALRCGFKVKEIHKLVFLARNRGDKYDLIFAGKQRVYAVKLWSALHTDSTLVVCPDNAYYVARGVGEPFEQKGRGEYNLRDLRKKVPDTQLTVKLRANREIVPILLFYPCYKKVMQRRGKDILIYEQGDRIFGKRMYFPDGFKQLILEGAEATRTDVATVSGGKYDA